MCASETGWARTSPLLRSCGGGPVYPTSSRSPVDGHQQCTDFDDSPVKSMWTACLAWRDEQ